MRWGLVPYWWSKPLKELKLATFNARAETVTEKPFFREPFKHRRCLIPASGYYEWHDTPGGKQPYYFTRRDGEPVTIAGLWDRWRDKAGGDTITSCTMVITEPNDFVRELHDRMPVILEPDQFEPWLSGEAGVEAREQLARACGRSDIDGSDRFAWLIYVRFGALYGLKSDMARRPLCARSGHPGSSTRTFRVIRLFHQSAPAALVRRSGRAPAPFSY
jgi:hypothetical protein